MNKKSYIINIRLKKIFFNIFFLLIANLVSLNNINASKKTNLTRSGDILQIANPVMASLIANNEKGVGHFGVIYGQSLAFMGASKMIGKSSKLQISKRPAINGKRNRFDGFPSGHTISAWSAASYTRIFSPEKKQYYIPMYFAAAVTGYSRVKAKEHTITQVVAAALLSETITYLNSKANWSMNYQPISIDIGKTHAALGVTINF